MHTVYGMLASGSWAFAVGDDGAIFHRLFAGEAPPYGLDFPESVERFDSRYGKGCWKLVFVEDEDASYDKVLQDLVEGSFIWEEGK